MSRMEILMQPFLLGIKHFFCGILHLVNFLLTDKIHSSLQRVPGNREDRKIVLLALQKCFLLAFACWFYYAYIHMLYIDFKEYGIFMETILKCIIWLIKLLSSTYRILLLIKIYEIVSVIFYQDIIIIIFKRTVIIGNLDDMGADAFVSITLLTFYCIQTHAVYLIPLPEIIQTLWYLVHLSFLFSLNAFDYKWFYMGWCHEKRLTTIEGKWPYFLGFGLPLALVCTFGHPIMSGIIMFSTFLDVYVSISAFTDERQMPAFYDPLPLFTIAEHLAVLCSHYLFQMLRAYSYPPMMRTLCSSEKN